MRPIYNIGEIKPAKPPVQTQRSFQDDEEEDGSSAGSRWYLKSVRNLINVFEQKDKEKHRPFRQNFSKSKSKSYANLRQPIQSARDVVDRFENHKQKPTTAFPELDAIRNTANSLKSKITESKTIESKECITYQNQIIALLTKIGSLESNGNPLIKEEKQKCLKIVQSCNTALKHKTGDDETAPMALGNFVKTLTKFEVNNNEPVSKVKILRGIFEAKKDNVVVQKPKKEFVKQSKPPLVIDDEFTYTPYSEYLKRKNSEENVGLSAMPQMTDTSKSCENIASHDYSGIKRLLNRLNDKKKETSHHRAKSLSDIKVASDLIASSTEDVLINSSVKSISTENVAVVEDCNLSNEEEENCEQEPEVKLVSVKPAEDAEIPVIVTREKSDTPIFTGNDEEITSESDEDSESDDHKHSSGFYSFVGDETLDDSFHDASDQEVKSEASYVNSYYEPFTNNVKCKMANGIVNITLNGVQVE